MAGSLEAVEIRYSEKAGVLIRTDAPEHLGESTWDLLESAIRQGKQAEAIRLLDFLHEGETGPRHYFFSDWQYGNLSYVIENFGEDAYPDMFRVTEPPGPTQTLEEDGTVSWPGWVQGFPPELLSDVEAMVRKHAEIMRSHWPPRGSIQIVEEEDRYVMSFFPCNSGGRMMRSGMTEGKWGLPVTTKPHDWSWGKTGKSIYCCHCALGRGMLASQARGYPVRLHDEPDSGFNPTRVHPFDPCRMIFYKSADLIPEKYFTALGLPRDPTKFDVVPSAGRAKKGPPKYKVPL